MAGVHGLPDEDPVVKNLRTRFTQAHSPTADDLLNKEFDCKIFLSIKSNFSRYTETISFKRFDGLYISDSDMALVDNGDELIGVGKFEHLIYYKAYRISKNNEILIEGSSPTKYSVHLIPIADTGNSKADVYMYGVCIQKN